MSLSKRSLKFSPYRPLCEKLRTQHIADSLNVVLGNILATIWYEGHDRASIHRARGYVLRDQFA